MGFPKEIKEKALIAAARRCCVCKEFKGRNIEVHHIIPKKEGGENTFENAIPLCFDCHSEAGHYDKFHPRGTKYSKDELRGHRDIWYEIVKKGNFANPSIDVVQSYYLTSEFPIIWEMIEGNFEDFPLDQVKLLKNELLSFLQTLKKYQKQQSRKSDIYGNSYKDLDEYQTNFPQAQNVRGKWTDHWERTPSEDELQSKILEWDLISRVLFESGEDISEISKVILHPAGCADDFFETFEIRNSKVLFWSIQNNGEKPIFLKGLKLDVIADTSSRPFSKKGKVSEKNIPEIVLNEGECAVIPIKIIVFPLGGSDYKPKEVIKYQHVKTGEAQDTRLIDLPLNDQLSCIGPSEEILDITLMHDENDITIQAKQFDPSCVMLISRYWECGCCPHLFAKNKSGNWEYLGELFKNSPGFIQEVTINVDEYDSLLIAELESEVTQIETVYSDGILVDENIILKKDDQRLFSVASCSSIQIKGFYRLLQDVEYLSSNVMKYTKVLHFLGDKQLKRITNKGLVTEFSERELGTNPWFKKSRVIGEKVERVRG